MFAKRSIDTLGEWNYYLSFDFRIRINSHFLYTSFDHHRVIYDQLVFRFRFSIFRIKREKKIFFSFAQMNKIELNCL